MKKKNILFDKNPLMFSFKNAFKDNIRHEPMVSLGNSFELLRLAHQVGWRVIYSCTDGPVSLFRELKILYGFCRYVLLMRKHHGPTTTVKYLKSCHLAIQKCISKDKISSLRELEPDLPLPRLTTSRLPRFIPLSDRRAILAGNAFRTRYWLTLFSLYRVIKIPGVLKINTITDPYSGDLPFLLRGIEDLKLLSSKNSFRFNIKLLSKEFGLLALETASPTYRSSWHGWISDVPRIVEQQLDTHLETLMKTFKQEYLLETFLFFKSAKTVPFREPDKTDYPSLGQLAIKEEAAGKLRVFALVDIWTQSVLKPLHTMIFDFLKSLPNDGTFDQSKAVQRAALKVQKFGQSFGYDLSAATDRLPILLQEAVLSPLIGKEAAASWKELLISRDYKLLFPDKMGTETITVRYAVGQPMGALSSWAMLALTHHLIVQLAYLNVRGNPLNRWYEEYELLGDDIVLFEEDIAKEYLRLMGLFGVGINLSKSVCSKNKSFEFAKVSWINGINVSAISWKMFISQNNLMGRVNIAFQLLNKLSLKHPIRYIKRITSRSLLEQGNYKFNLLALLSMFANSGKITIHQLLSSLITLSTSEKGEKGKIKLLENAPKDLNESYVESLIISILRGEALKVRTDELITEYYTWEVPFYHMVLKNKLTWNRDKLGNENMILYSLTYRLLNQLLPGYINDQEKFEILVSLWHLFLYKIGWKSEEWIEKAKTLLYVRDGAVKLLGDLKFYDLRTTLAGKDRDTLENLGSTLEKFDNLIQLLEITKRASDKLEGVTKSRVSDKSPLKMIAFIKQSENLRDLIRLNTYPDLFVDRFYFNTSYKRYTPDSELKLVPLGEQSLWKRIVSNIF